MPRIKKVKLLNCPCCNGKPYSGTEGSGWGDSFVSCNKCGLTMKGKAPCAGDFGKDLPAEEKWNKRYLPRST
jgi:hypothetical protein